MEKLVKKQFEDVQVVRCILGCGATATRTREGTLQYNPGWTAQVLMEKGKIENVTTKITDIRGGDPHYCPHEWE